MKRAWGLWILGGLALLRLLLPLGGALGDLLLEARGRAAAEAAWVSFAGEEAAPAFWEQSP